MLLSYTLFVVNNGISIDVEKNGWSQTSEVFKTSEVLGSPPKIIIPNVDSNRYRVNREMVGNKNPLLTLQKKQGLFIFWICLTVHLFI